MCIVSDTSLKGLIIAEQKYQEAKNWFERRDWGSIDGKLLIYPFDPENLGPFSYDLCVGDEVFVLRTKRKISMIKEKEVSFEPDDVMLVLTREYIGLPREFAASVKPRFCFVREGIIQSMTKIDPTWYGNIAVAIANCSKKSFKLRRNQAFCSLVIHKLDKPCSRILDSNVIPALGKESIEYFLEIGKDI